MSDNKTVVESILGPGFDSMDDALKVLSTEQNDSANNASIEAPSKEGLVEKSPTIKQPSNDILESGLNEIFGERFKTINELKEANIPGALDELETLRQSHLALSEENKVYLEKLNSSINNFANEDLYKINEFAKKTGNTDFSLISKIVASDLSQLSDLEVVKLKGKYEDPITANSPVYDKYLLKNYGLDRKFEYDEDLTEDEVAELRKEFDEDQEIAKLELKRDADKARKEFDALRSEIKAPEKMDPEQIKANKAAEDQKLAEQKEDLQKKWASVYDKYAENLNVVKYPIQGTNDKEPRGYLEYQISEEQKTSLRQEVIDLMTNSGFELKEESLPILTEYVNNRIIVSNLPNIISAAMVQGKEMTQEQYDSMIHNPSALQNNQSAKEKPTMSKKEQTEYELLNS